MAMEIKIIPQKNGLQVDFKNLTQVPVGTITYHWDFGDDNESDVKSPTHTYEKSDIYDVTLTIGVNGVNQIYQLRVLVSSDNNLQTLSDSIYNLIDKYIPNNIEFTFDDKRVFIEKWQLYILPLVNHEIPVNEFNNELKFDALENQLIMELSIIDYLTTLYYKVIQTGEIVSNIIMDNHSGVKKITTGPTDVEYFDNTDLKKSLIENATKALSKGGLIDTMKQNVCQLSERLSIYLPMCKNVKSEVIVPTITNKTIPSEFNVPNPIYPLNNN